MGCELEPALARFLDAEGRLRQWPARPRPREQAIRYLAALFEPGRRYSEAEVNALLNARHTFHDAATLRRTLFERGFLDRTPDGASYWAVVPAQ
jgi:hypothetical protein